MTVDRELVRKEVSSFLETRRTGKGFGGSGNPRETWEDVKSQVAFAVALDPDAVFTLVRWACSDLHKALAEIAASCSEIVDVVPCLFTPPKSIANLGSLSKGYKRLSRGLASARISREDAGAGKLIADASEKLDDFASTTLVKALNTSSDRSMSPAEARSSIRKEWAGIVERLEKVELHLTRIPTAMDAVSGLGTPHSHLVKVLGKAKDKVESVLQRMELQPARQRGREAAGDMARIAAVTTMIPMVSSPSGPRLLRGGPYAAVASGTGEGAKVVGTLSAPFRLLEGVSERVNIRLDGGAPSGDIVLPSQPNEIIVDAVPTSAVIGEGYGVVVNERFTIRCRGISGYPVEFPGTPRTPAQIVHLITSTPGAIPLWAGAPLVLYSSEPLLPSLLRHLRLKLNNAHLMIDDPDLGEYVEISGDVASMNAMGFSGHDAGDPTTKSERVYWRATEGVEVVRSLKGSINTGLEVAVGGDAMFSGSALISANPDSNIVHVCNYHGRAEWFPDLSKLILLEEGRERVRVGDLVTFNAPGTVTGLVEKLVEGSIILSGVVGSDPEGPYTVGITTIQNFIGASITFIGSGVATHSIGYTFLAGDGRMELFLTRPVYTGGLPGGGAVTLFCTINKECLTLGSSDKTVSGSIALIAPTTDSAYPGLGMGLGVRLPQLSYLSISNADLIVDKISINDVVVIPPPGLGTPMYRRVREVLGPERIRLDADIPGTVSGMVDIYNHLAWAYQQMLPTLSVWSSSDLEEIQRDVSEVLRVESPRSAGVSLQSQLAALGVMSLALQGALNVYIQATKAYPSSLMTACREALVEAGADRAVDLLVKTDLKGFFGATADDASYQRSTLKAMRILSRKMLGSSVYNPEIETERALLSPREEVSMDIEPMPMDNTRIPRGNRP